MTQSRPNPPPFQAPARAGSCAKVKVVTLSKHLQVSASAVMSAVRQSLAATARPDMLSHVLGLGRARAGLPLRRFLAPSVLRLQLATGRTGQAASQSSERALRTRGAFTKEEQLIIERIRNHETITELDVDGGYISYAKTITQGRVLNELTSEELRRALLMVVLIDSKGYRPEHFTLEKDLPVGSSKPRLDLLL